MRSARLRLAVAAVTAAAMLWIAGVAPSYAQSASKTVTLWVDQKTGQVFIRPGKGRRPLELPGAVNTQEIEQRVQRNVVQQTQQTIQKENAQLRAQLQNQQQQTQQIATQVKEIEPAWHSYLVNFDKKFRLSGLVYADYRFYTHTGFQPQELTQINNPGPGNELYNSFDITRTYLNFIFMPADGWKVRITPNIYRMVGGSSSQSFGKGAAIGSNLNGNMGYRLKYAYLQYDKPFNNVNELKGGSIFFGQVMNPLVDWEERLYNYRFVNLTPWNYLSLSSTQLGLKVEGPIRIGTSETKYADYDFGVFNNSSFHAYEATNTKEAMGRISLYPFGGTGDFNGLGFDGFYNYGYGNVTPDFVGSSPFFQAPQAYFYRLAAFVHYRAKNWLVAFEYDLGRNAFNSGNLSSGVGPSGAPYADFGSLEQALLNNGRAKEQGFDFFGFYDIPNTPFALFGMYEWFMPNTKVALNPLDFQRWIAGVSYKYNSHLTFALDTQNLSYYHGQFNFSKAYANSFAPVFSNPTGFVTDAVPRDTHAFFLNAQFSY